MGVQTLIRCSFGPDGTTQTHTNLMTLKFKSLAWTTSQNCTHISNCLSDIPTWMSNRWKPNSSSFSTLTSPSCLSPHFMMTPLFQSPSPKALESSSTSFFFFFFFLKQTNKNKSMFILEIWGLYFGTSPVADLVSPATTQVLWSKWLSSLLLHSTVSLGHKEPS